MKRHCQAWAALVLAASLAGCAMCQNSFDYCGPIAAPDGWANCDFGARRGSLFAPMDESAAATQLGPTPAEMPAGSDEMGALDTLVR